MYIRDCKSISFRQRVFAFFIVLAISFSMFSFSPVYADSTSWASMFSAIQTQASNDEHIPILAVYDPIALCPDPVKTSMYSYLNAQTGYTGVYVIYDDRQYGFSDEYKLYISFNDGSFGYSSAELALGLSQRDVGIYGDTMDRSYAYNGNSYGTGALVSRGADVIGASWDVFNTYTGTHIYVKGGSNLKYGDSVNNVSGFLGQSFYAVEDTITVKPGYAISFTSTSVPGDYVFDFYCDDGDAIGRPHFLGTSLYSNQFTSVTNLPPDPDYPFNINDESLFQWDVTKSGLLQKVTCLSSTIDLTLTSSGNTYTFYNMPSADPYGYTRTGDVDITYDDSLNVTIQPIISDENGYIGMGVGDTDAFVVDGSIVDGEGNPYDIPWGGEINENPVGTYDPSDFVAVTDDTSIVEAIHNLGDRLVSIFAPGIQAIQSLITMGSDFMESLTGIFAWLPGDLSSVITSALILIVIIGVFKVLL